jgi:dienelactone hydrolase
MYMYWVRRFGILFLVAGLVACSAGPALNTTQSATITALPTSPGPIDTPLSSVIPAPSRTPTGFLASWGCSSQLPSTDVAFSSPQGVKLQGTILGDGDTGVVISNQSGGEFCPWLPLVEVLVKKHSRVLLYQAGSGDQADLVSAAAAFMIGQGLKQIILIGASQGAKASIVAAARRLPGVIALVSLSAEGRLGKIVVEPYAEQLKLPVLFVTSEQDEYGSMKASQTFFNVAPVKDKQLVVVPGTAHGYDLLSDPSVMSAVEKFVGDHQAAAFPGGTGIPPAAPSASIPSRATPLITPPPLLAACPPPLAAQAVAFNTSQGVQLSGALIGTMDTAVVISNQSGNSVCQWTAFIPQLTAAGFAVLVYQYGSTNRLDDLQSAVAYLTKQGFQRIILLGGSQGAELTVITAGKDLPGVIAAVSLSADEYLAGVDAASFAAQVKIPILFITAKEDPYGSYDTSTKFYSLAATPQSEKLLVVVPGSDHGYELLSDPSIQAQVLKFMQDYR